jgi:site-specific DNA recombinase
LHGLSSRSGGGSATTASVGLLPPAAVESAHSRSSTADVGRRLKVYFTDCLPEFEREVIGERIRDKVAASRKRGMWMGGFVPMGYRVESRKLILHEVEAAIIRMIFDRFLKLDSASATRGTPVACVRSTWNRMFSA